jgi:4-diphosphocytidyl-2-C-methyl-D-erythritol kinase
MQAGLGGGSTDAAATLNLMNEAFGGRLNADELTDVAKSIGADVPFFILGGTALCEGIGEIITPVSPLDGLPLLLIKPPDGISTPEAYAEYDRANPGGQMKTNSQESLLTTLFRSKSASSIDRIRLSIPYIMNDFEPIASEKVPDLKSVFCFLETHDAILVRMSGSGSAVFGVFANTMARDAAWKAAEKYSSRGFFVCPCETIGTASNGSKMYANGSATNHSDTIIK